MRAGRRRCQVLNGNSWARKRGRILPGLDISRRSLLHAEVGRAAEFPAEGEFNFLFLLLGQVGARRTRTRKHLVSPAADVEP